LTLAPHETQRTGRGPDDEASRLYAEFGDKIYRFCLGRLRSREEAEDAVQNTFLRVCTALRKGVVPEFEGPWLYKIAHNVCLSRLLGSSRRAQVEMPADLDLLGERAAAYTADADELFGLDEALAEMPANLRRPLLMREWQGMSYTEIAEAIGVSHSAVETLIFRARRHLAQALTDQVKKTGRAVASVFNLRWLFDLVKGLGGGAGSAGVAAIGGGVAIDLVTQHASASRTAISTSAAATRMDSSNAAAVSARRSGSTGAARSSSGSAHGDLSSGGLAGSSSGSGPAGGAPSDGSGSASPSSRSSSSSKSGSSGSSGTGSAAKGSPKQGSPGAGAGSVPPALPSAPSVPDPGSALPPAGAPAVPGVPPVPPLPPPSLPPPPLPVPSPPTITTPGNLIAEATGPLGAVVAYTVTATDLEDGTDPVTCTPASGATFGLGHSTVSCSSTDRQGNTSRASFDVLVQDTTPPALAVPAGITVQTTLTSGVKVTFTATATDLVDAAPKVTCNPASGSLFLVQTTTVTCIATDSSGNSSSKSFDVTVKLVPPLG
jgi:RNA polymerase sigma factor (sigma-70 family)